MSSTAPFLTILTGTLNGTIFTPVSNFFVSNYEISDAANVFSPGDTVEFINTVSIRPGVVGTGTYLGYTPLGGTNYLLIRDNTDHTLELWGAHNMTITYTINTIDMLPVNAGQHDFSTFNPVTKLGGTGPNANSYAWSTAANWTNGIPSAYYNLYNVSANVGAQYDDVSLHLNALDISGGQVTVASSLLVELLAVSTSTTIVADGSVNVTNVVGLGATYVAQGGKIHLYNDYGGTYEAQSGGTIELGASPSDASRFSYGNSSRDGRSTFALHQPKAINNFNLSNVQPQDVLEVPGTSLVNLTFGLSSLAVTTSAGSYTFTSVSYGGPINGFRATYDAATGLEAITFLQKSAADFNGDGKSDMLWQSEGTIVDFTMNGSTIVAANPWGSLDSTWNFLATGDFWGDGNTSMLWQAGGTIVDFEMIGNTIYAAIPVGTLDSSWKFLALGDFNGDGKSEMLWQSRGEIVDFTMTGPTITSATGVANLDSSYKFLAAADFNGDGKDDMLWQASDGTIFDFTMNGSSIIAASTVGALDSSWKFLAAADYNGDGKADMLWQNANGGIVDYSLNGSSIISADAVGSLDNTWTFLKAGDFNGDGKADMLWQSGGTIVDYSLNGSSIISADAVGSLDSTWKLLS